MNGNRQTILIVDDIPDDIIILDEILKNDYQVKAATSGEAALKIARSDNPPDLILLDIMMPEMDGFEVCRRLKQDTRGAMIPVIFLTAKIMTTDEKTGLELGAVDYIRKPVDPDIVLTRVKMHLEQKERNLCASEIRFRRLFETSKDGVMIFDSGSELVIEVNPSMAKLLGHSQEYFLGKKVSEFGLPENFGKQKSESNNIRQGEYIRRSEEPIYTADGREIYVQYFFNTYSVDNRELTQVNFRDITDLVNAEKERDILSARLAHYLSTSPTVTYSLILKDGKTCWKWVSENMPSLLGYSSGEALVTDWWFDNIHANDRSGALTRIKDLMIKESATSEYRFTRKDRSLVWLHDEMRLVHGIEDSIEIVGTLTDISERKKAEEEIHLKSEALEATANAVIITDLNGTIRWANHAFEFLSGYTVLEAIGKNPGELVNSGKQSTQVYRKMWDLILAGSVWSGELINRKKSGELYHEEMTITPVSNSANEITNFIAVKSDITERKKAEELITKLLKDKDLLLKEVHHRIKNNMTTIRGLLSMQISTETNAAAAESLRDAESRVHSIMMLYDRLYCTDNYRELSIKDYLQPLTEEIVHSYSNNVQVAIKTDIEDFILNIRFLSPIGIIVNELITNMLKHAFIGRVNNMISISAALKDDHVTIILQDNGIGLPESITVEKSTGFGMQIVGMLSEQMHGKLQVVRGDGTRFILEFNRQG